MSQLRLTDMRTFNSTVLLVAVFCSASALADPALPNPYTYYSVSIVAGQSSGSGFFLQASNSVYLVTARHVLFDISKTNCPLWALEAECRVLLNETSPTVMAINLELLSGHNEIRYSTNHDAVIVRVEDCNPTNATLIHTLPGVVFRTAQYQVAPIPSSLAKRFEEITPGTDIFLFGFPSSIGLAEMPQIDPALPLMRKGIVAGKNLVRHTIILDCPSYQGNSGGPVIGKVPEGVGSVNFPLIGVLIEWVPFSEAWQNTRFGYRNQTLSNSGYSIAVPMDVVLGLIWK